MKFHHHQLPNGLDIIAEVAPEAYSMGVGYFVKTGSRDETPEIAGVSHFLEHMMFKGTARRTAEDVNRELDEIGSHANAYTSEERTVYYATVLPEYQAKAVDVLSDMMRPALRTDDFEMEKQVIVEEICKYEDQPPYNAHEKAMEAYFHPHPMGNSVLGTEETVTGLTPEAMREYFTARYSPGNMVLAAAGNVDFDALVKQAEVLCGSWQPYTTSRDAKANQPTFGHKVIHKEIATQQYVVQMAPGPAADDDDRFAARVMATVIGDDSGSRLYWELIETGRAESAAVYPSEYDGTGILMGYLCCAPEQTADNLVTMAKVYQEAESQGVTADEVERAQSKICSHMVLRAERPASRLFAVGGGWITRGKYRSLKDSIDRYQAVTPADVASILEKYPLSKNMTVAVGPLTELPALSSDASD